MNREDAGGNLEVIRGLGGGGIQWQPVLQEMIGLTGRNHRVRRDMKCVWHSSSMWTCDLKFVK